jgi:hypothetical protein
MDSNLNNIMYITDENHNIWLIERRKNENSELYLKIVSFIANAHESKITGIYSSYNHEQKIPFLVTTSFDKTLKLWNLECKPFLSGIQYVYK